VRAKRLVAAVDAITLRVCLAQRIISEFHDGRNCPFFDTSESSCASADTRVLSQLGFR